MYKINIPGRDTYAEFNSLDEAVDSIRPYVTGEHELIVNPCGDLAYTVHVGDTGYHFHIDAIF